MTQKIVTPVVDDPRYGRVAVSYGASTDPYTISMPQRNRSDAAVSIDALLYLGAEYPIGRSINVTQRLAYTLPITSTLSNGAMKLATLQGLIELEWRL